MRRRPNCSICRKKRRLIGKPVSEIMDDYSLASILAFERNLMQDEIYLEDQKCYLDRVMTNDKENKNDSLHYEGYYKGAEA